MAHEIYIVDGKASMAYAANGGKAWHGLGTPMSENATIEEWQKACGFDWEIKKAEVLYVDNESDRVLKYKNKFVLYRSDTNEPISIMSERYKEVQPAQVLDFFKDVCESQRWSMETAGVLKNGAQYWALAKAGLNAYINKQDDRHELYMLLSTSADGSLSTSAKATDIRVVCNNTLQMAMRMENNNKVTVRHDAIFDAKKIKEELQMIDMTQSWDEFMKNMRQLSEIEIEPYQATAIFSELLRPKAERSKPRNEHNALDFDSLLNASVGGGYTKIETDKERKIRYLDDLEHSYVAAPGATPGTAYGLLNAVTHFVDHTRGKPATRLGNAWFGSGAALKQRTMDVLDNMIA